MTFQNKDKLIEKCRNDITSQGILKLLKYVQELNH